MFFFGGKKNGPFGPAKRPNPTHPNPTMTMTSSLNFLRRAQRCQAKAWRKASRPRLPGPGGGFRRHRKKSPLSGKVSGQKNQPAGFERIDLFVAKSMSFKKCQVKYATSIKCKEEKLLDPASKLMMACSVRISCLNHRSHHSKARLAAESTGTWQRLPVKRHVDR